MAEEQIRSVIGVTYVGAGEVQRYLNDLQRAGAVTEATAARLSGVWRSASAGTLDYTRAIRELAAGLNQGEAAIRRFLAQYNNLASGRNASSFVAVFNRDVEQLNRITRQAAMGMDAMAQARRRLASAFAIQLGARVQDQMAGPVAVAAANPRLALPAPTIAPTRDDRRLDRIMGVLERRELHGGIGVTGGSPFASTNASVEFERLNPVLRQTESRVRALTAALNNLQAQARGRPSMESRADVQAARTQAVAINRAELQALAQQHRRSDYNQALPTWAEMQPRTPQDRRLLSTGAISAQHVRAHPDLMQSMFGMAKPEDLVQGIGRGGVAEQLPGLTSVSRVMTEMQAEFDTQAGQALAQRQERLFRAAARLNREMGVAPLPRTALSTLQGLWQQQMVGIPGLGRPELLAGVGGGGALARRDIGTAYGVTDPRIIAGQARAAAQAELASRMVGTSPISGGAFAGHYMPGIWQQGMGTSVDARTLLAQQAARVIPGTVTSSTTTPLGGPPLSADAQLAQRLMTASGGDMARVQEGMRGLGITTARVKAAFDELNTSTTRRRATERAATQATEQNTAAERANTSATAQSTAVRAGTLGAYQAGMRVPIVPHEPVGSSRTFVAGGTGTYETLPAVRQQPGQMQAYPTGNLPAIRRQTSAQMQVYDEAERLARAQRELRQRLTQYASTVAVQNRIAAATAGGTMPPPRVMPGAFAGYGMPTARQPQFFPYMGGRGGGIFGGGGAGGGGGSFGGRFGGGGFGDDAGAQGFMAQFQSGFRGRGEAPYAQQIGQTFKFATFYGAAYKILFAITQTFQQTLSEAVAFQEAMVDLNIATGETTEANRELAATLGQTAAQAGFQPGEGVTAGARAIGLYGLTQAPRAEQEMAARTSTRVATMLAFGSGRPHDEIQANLGAISQGFNVGYAEQERVADLDAYLSRRFGIKAGATIEPVAQTAAVANLAGFNLEEAMAISANLQSRTGMASGTIGGLLSQVFTRSGEGSLTQVSERYGIDTSQTLRDQMVELGEVYKQISPRQQAEMAASFGRGRSQNVAAVLLGDAEEIFNSAVEAHGDATGAAEEQFQERLKNIGGQLAELRGQFFLFAKALGEAGLLTAVGLGVKAFGLFFDAVTPILNLFASLPGPMNEVIFGLGALAIATKAGAAGAVGTGLIDRAGMMTGGRGRLAGMMGMQGMATRTDLLTGNRMLVARQGQMAAGPTILGAPGTGATAMSGAGRAITGASTAFRAAGSALLGLVGPVGLAIGGLMAISAVTSSMKRIDEASKELADVAKTGISTFPEAGGVTPEWLRSQAALYGEQADVSRGATGWFHNLISLGQANDMPERDAAFAERQSKYYERLAGQLEADMEAAIPDTSPIFEAFDPEGLQAGLERLAQGGASTQVQIDSLTTALFDVGGAASAARAAFEPEEQADLLAPALAAAAQAGPGGEGYTDINAVRAAQGPSPYTELTTGDELSQALRQAGIGAPKVRRRLEKAFEELNISDARELNQMAPEVADIVADGWAEAIAPEGATERDINRLRREIRRSLIANLRQQTRKQADLLDPNKEFTGAEAIAAGAQLTQQYESRIGQLPETDYQSRRQMRGELLRSLRQVRAKAAPGEDLTALNAMIMAEERNWGQARFEEIDQLRIAEQSRAKSRADVIKIGKQRVAQMVKDAVKTGNMDALVDLIEDGGRFAVTIAMQAIDDALHVARAAATISLMAEGAEGDISQAMKILASPRLAADEKVKQLQGMKGKVRRTPRGKTSESERIYGTDVPDYEAPEEAADRATAAQIAAARAASQIASDDAVGQARVALQSAQADLAALDKKDDPVAYWNAVQAVNDARKAYADAQVEASAAARMINIAPDDAVAQAAADIQNARDEVAAATPGTVAHSQALRDLNQAQHAYAQAQNEVANAAAEAEAARDGGAIAAARVQIANAARAMRTATEGTAAYYQALASFYQGQQALGEAMREYNANRFLLARDITDPLVQARAAMRTAAQKLAADRRAGRGEDVIAADELDVRRAQAEVEATKFSQRLQQVQTADDLGRISHQRYIRYLENEQNRLEGIKNRTFQQQQHLNEIDQALQSAYDQMQGQFNLGDIDTSGLVYQTRLAAAERCSGSRRNNVNQTVSIQVDGADVAKVRQILTDLLGPNAGQTRTVMNRKV